MEQAVQFVRYESNIEYGTLYDQFRLRPDCGWVWLQKLCFWILGRIGCFALTTKCEAVRIAFDGKTFMDNLIAQEREMVRLYHERGEHLLLGREEFSELVRMDVMMNHPTTFNAPYRYTKQANGEVSIGDYQMRVTVIPWMKGPLGLGKGWNG